MPVPQAQPVLFHCAGSHLQWAHVAGFFQSKRYETGLQLVQKQPLKERMFQTECKGVLHSSLVMV